MAQSQIVIRIPYHDFMKYQDVNNVMPKQLISFCKESSSKLTLRDSFLKDLNTIIDNVLSGVNPNDIVFKNNIREYMNKINNKTYTQYVDMLKKLNYNTEQHFAILAYELIVRSMTDVLAVKGLDLNRAKDQKSLSEIYVDICSEFSTFFIRDGEKDVKFLVKLLELCEKTFTDFVDPDKPLDPNNMYRVDHFKGFMNFLGLLFNRGLLSHKITQWCLTKLRDLIFKSNWGQVECDNVYDGYKRFLNQILMYHERRMKETERSKAQEYLRTVQGVHKEIEARNKETPKLKKLVMMAHNELDERLRRLVH